MSGLCYRCEYRAQFLENKRRPRHECGVIEEAVNGCYMFKPVKPIVVAPRDGDDRPVTLNLFSARVERKEEDIPLKLHGENTKEGILVYWKPDKDEEK